MATAQNPYGTVGRNITQNGGDPAQSQGYFDNQFDPRYMESYQYDRGDSDMATAWRLKPEWSSRVGDLIQVGPDWQSNIGKPGAPRDGALVRYDEQLGWVTPAANVAPPDNSGFVGFLNDYLPYIFAAGMGGQIAALETGGMAGAELGGLAPEEAAMGHAASSGVPGGGAAFGSPGFGAGEFGDIIANLGAGSPPPASFGSPGFGAGESFFGADTLGLGGGGGALGTGTSLVWTGLGEGALVGELGSGLSLAGTGLAPGVVTGTGAVAGGGMSFLEQLLSKVPNLMDQLPGITDALGGGAAGGAGRAAGGGGGGGGMSSSPGGRMAGRVQFEQNPYGKSPGAPNVLDLLSYVRGAR